MASISRTPVEHFSQRRFTVDIIVTIRQGEHDWSGRIALKPASKFYNPWITERGNHASGKCANYNAFILTNRHIKREYTIALGIDLWGYWNGVSSCHVSIIYLKKSQLFTLKRTLEETRLFALLASSCNNVKANISVKGCGRTTDDSLPAIWEKSTVTVHFHFPLS